MLRYKEFYFIEISIIKIPTPYLLGSLAVGASRIARIVKPLLNFC